MSRRGDNVLGVLGAGSAATRPCVLALETSCDETAVAVLRGREVLASEVASQSAIHAEYGGVVPEVASRNHARVVRPLLRRTLELAGVAFPEIDAVAATHGPGLATSLMIGLSVAKGISVALNKPFFPVNHMEGHLLSPFMGTDLPVADAIGLIVSGGHTLLVRVHALDRYTLLGSTVDDAAGEAFDKVGKLLGLPYPGGPQVSARAEQGDPQRFDFPRSMLHSGDYQFSFSGLKTAVRYLLPKHDPVPVEDVCASFQEAVVDVLVAKTLRALSQTGVRVLAVSGGVSCNRRLRDRLEHACADAGVRLLLAAPDLCTDNAAMIGHVAVLRHEKGAESRLDADVEPNLRGMNWLLPTPAQSA